jgi:hypothetical protein
VTITAKEGLASFLEDTLAITEGGDVSSGVLLVHGLAGELFGNHVSEDTHLGGSAVVQFNIELAGLLFGVLDVGSKVTNSVVSVVLGCRHPCQLNKSEEGKDLGKSGGGDGTDTIGTGGDIRELQVVGWGKVSIEDDVVVVGDDTNNGSHGDTSVLALDGTTAFEGLGLGLEPSKRIVETKGLGDTKFELTDLKGRGSLGGLGRGEGGGRSGEEGGNSELHLDSL